MAPQAAAMHRNPMLLLLGAVMLMTCTAGCSAADIVLQQQPLRHLAQMGPVPLPDMAAVMRPLQQATNNMVIAGSNNRAAQNQLQAALKVARVTIPARKIPYNDGTLLFIFINGTQVEMLRDGNLQQQLPSGAFVNVTRRYDAVRLRQLRQYLFSFPTFSRASPPSSGRRLLRRLETSRGDGDVLVNI